MDEIERRRLKLQEMAIAEVRDPPRATRVITREEAEADLMAGTDREKLDIVTLNDVCHDLSELSGMLLGRGGQGGMLREIKDDVGDIKLDLKAMEKRHDEEIAKVCAKTDQNTQDIHAAHDKIRIHDKWISRQERGFKAVWSWLWKVLASVASGVTLLWAGSRLFGGGG